MSEQLKAQTMMLEENNTADSQYQSNNNLQIATQNESPVAVSGLP
jgi:hypothetical protein